MNFFFYKDLKIFYVTVLIWLFVCTVSAFKKFYSLTFSYKVLFSQKLLYIICVIEFL